MKLTTPFPPPNLPKLILLFLKWAFKMLFPGGGGHVSLLLNVPLKSLMEKAMAPHSSTLAWKIPWTEEPGGLQSMGSLRVGHD